MSNIFGSGFRKPTLAIPGLRGQLKGCFGINRVPSLPYLAKGKKGGLEIRFRCLFFCIELPTAD